VTKSLGGQEILLPINLEKDEGVKQLFYALIYGPSKLVYATP
jgi:hypothetical protein